MKLFQLLLGAEVPGRVVEQHDYFFGIAGSIAELVPQVKAFWPEAGASLHIDGWREVTKVDSYGLKILPKDEPDPHPERNLYFLNLGGYTSGKLEEQHYTILTVQASRLKAVQAAKNNLFFKTNSLKGIATAHIDEKYGIDVDSVHAIGDLLSPAAKARYRIIFEEAREAPEDRIHLGYFKLDKI
ncbi:DUF1543 domain-containing protein [Mucilaginibacter corticis]|uniref:DUF1543 domain-containing protein n=1 Tax=Mucilaginibacter corticis TaxID=2597670 RepID=A0A556M992_9SPHI|nr:DUF1543 domain-containing protein [Mucilaginibacter corticis]TSJ36375.1 DUF1543 domain-containing protein [Mucilaginibacter corticis]